MLRSFVTLVVVLLVGAGLGGIYWTFVEAPAREAAAEAQSAGAGNAEPVPVEVTQVRVAPAESTVTAVGTLMSNESSILRPEVSGRITKIQFEEGTSVERGQILVKLDDDVETAELASAEAAFELAKANLARATELRKSNVGTQRALDEAQAEMRRTEAAVALAEAMLAKRWLKAAFDARVGLRQVSLGDYVSVGQDIVNLEQIDPLKVEFRVPEIFLRELEVGQSITVTVDAFPDQAFQGEVYAINPLIDAAGRSIVIRARLANPDERLRPGLFARVTLTLAEKAQALWVPEEAIIPQAGRQYVFKVVAGATGGPPIVHRTEVVLGKRLPGQVEIMSGLTAEDRVVSAGVTKVREGAPVTAEGLETSPVAPRTSSRDSPTDAGTAG